MAEWAGDIRSRFDAIALPWMPTLYGAAVRLTDDAEDASELVLETYLRAFGAFDRFVPGANGKAWLFTILWSAFANTPGRPRPPREGASIEALERRYHDWLTDPRGISAPPPNFADTEAEEALRQLPESFRSAVLLVDVEELSYEEAAAVLDCPVGTLRSRLVRARKALFGALAGPPGEVAAAAHEP